MTNMKIFRGYPRETTDGGFLVTMHTQFGLTGGVSEETPLPPRFDLKNHSPNGYAWGYAGSGPGQLALAILAQLMSDDLALRNYMKFKCDVIAALPHDKAWELTEEQIRERIPEHKAQFTIKFLHRYRKLSAARDMERPRARLLQVIVVKAEELAESFLEYDTTYEIDEEHAERYPLPEKGTMLLLIFEGTGGIFTTVRPFNPQKAAYYRSATGAMFDIVINSSPEQQ